jgi:hypothetical protein
VATLDDAISYIFTWESYHDPKVCPKCFALNGREYTNQDLFDATLIDSQYGAIWDLDTDHSLAHGSHKFSCRCQIAVCLVIDWSKIPELYALSEGNLAMSMYQRAPGTSIAELRNDVRGLKGDIFDTEKEAAKLNELLTTYVALARKMGLPPPLMDFIAKAQQARVTVQTLIHTIRILYTTSGPIGWLLGLGGLAVSGFMIADLIDIERRTH